MSRYAEFACDQIQTQPFAERVSTVQVEHFATPPQAGRSFAEFLESLPALYAGNSIRKVASRIVEARRRDRAVVLSCGGHVIKCGLAPMLIGLMERGLITAIAVNGAVAIHDSEIALFGATSENVEQGLQSGTFGMAEETAAFYNTALLRAAREKRGAGESLGSALLEQKAPYRHLSLLAKAYALHIPVTVHIALGTDIIHMHPGADGAALGETSLRDFRILTAAMRSLSDGGVLLNIGSAVVLPEVLLKSIALLRNESRAFTRFLGVNLDMIQHYRSNQQVVSRVQAIGGEGLSLTGHHEIMIPLLAYAVLEAWEQPHE
jgi:hypothetical protein